MDAREQTDLPSGPVHPAAILIVDDRRENRFALEAILSDLGHSLVEAASGEEAIEKLTQRDFALVLLDVQMPGIDGFETAKLIRQEAKHRTLPIIFLTAFDSDQFPVEQAYTLGAVDYLVKPLVPAIIRAKVSSFVDLFTRSREIERQADRIRRLEREQLEKRLESVQRNFAILADSAPVGIFETDPAGHCLYVNGKWCEFAGMPPQDAFGSGWINALHPDDRARVTSEWYQAAAKNEDFSSDYRFRAPDGRITWLHGSAVALRDEAGDIRGYLGSVTDITARRVAENDLRRHKERLELAQEAGRIGTFDWNIQTNSVEWSKTEEELFGLTPGTFGGRLEDWAAFVHPDDRERAITACLQAVEQRTELFLEFRIQRPDGETRWISARGRVMYEGDTPLQMIGVNIDVTERKEFEAKLREADRRKDDFLAMLGHELRNPLAPLRSGLDLLMLDQPGQEMLRVMIRQVDHLVRLVDDLLDVSRIVRGKIELRLQRVELGQVLTQAIETAGPLIEGFHHQLIRTLPTGKVWLDADPIRLAQVFANLLTNAAKYTPPQGQIWLEAEVTDRSAEIRVRDNGIGISADFLPHVFELFAQAERSSDRSEGGLGIGLTLAKQIAEMHRGTITVRSDGPGNGSEFRVNLPIATGSIYDLGDDRIQQNRFGLDILVVDDNLPAAKMLAALLTRLGHDRVRTSADGKAALKEVAVSRPNVIFLDIGLPEMDGLEVARRIREAPENEGIFIAALTGYGSVEDRERSISAGCNEHLVKPVDLHALQEVLAAASLRTSISES